MNSGLPYSSKEFGRKSRSHDILRQVVERCNSKKEYVAVCIFILGAFDYSWQDELIQLEGGGFLAQSWSDPSKEPLSNSQKVQLDIDFNRELNSLRNGQFKLRSMLNKNPDLKTGKEFLRIGRIFLAVGNEGEWIDFPRQIMGGHYENNAINRLCQAFEIAFSNEGKCSFTLVEREEAKPILESIEDWPEYLIRQGMELHDMMFVYRQPIQAYVTAQLAHDVREMGIELQTNQAIEVIGSSYKKGGRGLIEFIVKWSPEKKPLVLSPTYLRLNENEVFYSEIKAYQDNLRDLKWISR